MVMGSITIKILVCDQELQIIEWEYYTSSNNSPFLSGLMVYFLKLKI